ncbi:MAG: hypothetical protein P8Z78_03935 [Gammaproteobacteria bacterium]|jgi:hypothetical protein
MTPTRLFRLGVFCVAVLFSACTAIDLRDANQQLVTYYTAKQNALAAQQKATASGDEDSFVILEGLRDSFGLLGEQAFAQAGAARDPLNRIAFYRIATTAAWQAQNGKAGDYAAEGVRLCEAGNKANAPTDCALLIVMPSLASVDVETRKLNQLDKSVSAPGHIPTEDDRQQAEAIFGALSDAFTRLLRQRMSTRGTPVSESFVIALDRNIGILLCQHIAGSALGELGQVESTVERMQAASIEVSKMKCDAIAAGINPSHADCLVPRPSQCR